MKAYEPVCEKFSVPLKRDEKASVDFRKQGLSQLSQGKLFEALESLNKSLCTSQLKSKEIALAFAGRAAVYLDAKSFDKCLENVELARSSGFPAEKMDTLNFLEEKCRNLMKTHTYCVDDDPWNFFKLSYPAHAKIPFIVNCLELRSSKEFGRLVITNQGFKFIFVELFCFFSMLFIDRFDTWRYSWN